MIFSFLFFGNKKERRTYMCGIKTVLYCCERCYNISIKKDEETFMNNLKHRGPDSTKIYNLNNFLMGFHRLSLINISAGTLIEQEKEEDIPKPPSNQPFYEAEEDCYFVCNGEIFNYKKIQKDEKDDCKIIFNFLLKNYHNTKAVKFFFENIIDGEFSFIFYNRRKNILLAGRDNFGVRPLYYCFKQCFYNPFKYSVYLASEIKGIVTEERGYYYSNYNILPVNYLHFPPGHILFSRKFISSLFSFKKSLLPNFYSFNFDIKQSLINAVSKRIFHIDATSEKRFGCLLSGGVDSSLVTAIAFKLLADKFGEEYAKQNLYTFSVYYGTQESEDILHAKLVAASLGIKHHYIFSFNYEDVCKLISLIPVCIESYDITTVRASLPQYYLGQQIKRHFPFIRFVLSGEGADEIFGGYRYMKGVLKLPSCSFSFAKKEILFIQESIKLIDEIHYFDGNRTDKTLAAASVEVRLPFLDKDFVYGVFNNVSPFLKMPTATTEKMILRNAFQGWIPDKVLYRSKEAFSDSVNAGKKNWFNILFKNIDEERSFYRNIFDMKYGRAEAKNVIPHYWLPNPLFTDGVQVDDPSAKILK